MYHTHNQFYVTIFGSSHASYHSQSGQMIKTDVGIYHYPLSICEDCILAWIVCHLDLQDFFQVKTLKQCHIVRNKLSINTGAVFCLWSWVGHYSDVIMGTMVSQITSLTIVYLTIDSGADQGKHQSSVSLAFVWEIHWWPVNSPHKWPVTRKMFSFDDVIMDDKGLNHWETMLYM